MSDTFAFRAVPVPLHRRINIRVAKTASIGLLLVAVLGAFTRWTVSSERESFARGASHVPAAQPAAQIPYTDDTVGDGSVADVGGIPAADGAAQDALRQTMSRARALSGQALDLTSAGPGQLAGSVKGLTFTDGPSLSATIISVAATGTGWAAAAMSDSGLCFAMRLGADGAVRFGTIPLACTGTEALTVSGASW